MGVLGSKVLNSLGMALTRAQLVYYWMVWMPLDSVTRPCTQAVFLQLLSPVRSDMSCVCAKD